MNNESKKLFNSPAWAIDAPTNRAEFDDPTITPQIDPGQGWGSNFSRQDGDLVDRRHMNEVLCQTTSAAKLVLYGVPPHDMQVNYTKWAFTNDEGVLWISNKITGPDTNNAVKPSTPNQTVWERIEGSKKVPAAPEEFVGSTPESNTIVAQWKAGKDNGAKITTWKFQHKTENGSWLAEETLDYPYKKMTNLTAGQKYQVRAKGINQIGEGEWGYSVIGATGFIPVGTVPGGGVAIALVAEPGDKEVKLTWKRPDDGGYPITGYKVEWKRKEDAYGQHQTTTAGDVLETNIQHLENDSLYFFRVSAENQAGFGKYSNEVFATPKAKVPEEKQPSLNAPELEALSTTSILAVADTAPNATGRTASISSYAWEYREYGLATWQKPPGSRNKITIDQGIMPEKEYEVRYTVTTSLGNEGPSPVATVETPAPAPPDVVEYKQPTAYAPRIRELTADTISVTPNVRFDSNINFQNATIETIQWYWRIKNPNSIYTSTRNRTFSWSNNPIELNLDASESIEIWYAVKTTAATGGGLVQSSASTFGPKRGKPGEATKFSLRSAVLNYNKFWYPQGYSSSGNSRGYTRYGSTPLSFECWFTVQDPPNNGDRITSYQVQIYRNGNLVSFKRVARDNKDPNKVYTADDSVGQYRIGDDIQITVQAENSLGKGPVSEKSNTVEITRRYILTRG